MPALCDVNVLLALSYDRHIHHAPALAWLDEQDEGQVILCRATQMSLLRLLCNATIMGEDTCTLAQAWHIYDEIMTDERFRFYEEPVRLETHWRNLTQLHKASPRLWQDSYLAAFALASGVQLVTFDRGFKQYVGLALTLI